MALPGMSGPVVGRRRGLDTVARLACLMVGLIIGGPLLGLTALILIAAFR